jgi:hypothetical protein
MRSRIASGDSRLLFWLRVREFAVPPAMIETATVRRAAGDWAGACAAARVDVDLNLRELARTRGRDFAARVRADLRHLTPDLLRWHMPRVAPDGLLRPGLTISLAQYQPAGPDPGRPVHLVARTPPAWADAGQRISLTMWDEAGSGGRSRVHPHPRPNPRFRLDLHRHLWDARRVGELWDRSGAGEWPARGRAADRAPSGLVPMGHGYAVDRWAAEVAILLRAEGRVRGVATVRLGKRHRLLLDLDAQGDAPAPPTLGIAAAPARGGVSRWPVLPDAATWVLPDLELLHIGLIEAEQLHPLVAPALVPGHPPASGPRIPGSVSNPRLVECRGARHRIGIVDGALVPMDHDATEIRREELLAALGGTPLPCLRAIDDAHRRPACLVDIRARLDHGDAAGALAAVEDLLGPDVLLRGGALRDELETAALRQIAHGLYRAGLAGLGPVRVPRDNRRHVRAHPRHATSH